METHAYESMYALEDDYWWYRALRDLVRRCVEAYIKDHTQPLRILDAGCGTGANLELLKNYGQVTGVDLARAALNLSQHRHVASLAQASLHSLPFENNAFDIILCADVLYHRAIEDDADVVRELARVLKPGGLFIAQVPALHALKGGHDEVVHTRQRYHKRQLQSLLEAQGFNIQRLGYRYAFTLPLLLLRRWIQRSPNSDLQALPSVINQLLYGLMKFENRLFGRRGFMAGSSLFCCALREL